MQIQTGKVTADINLTESSKKTAVVLSRASAGVIGTVPANKVWRIIALGLSLQQWDDTDTNDAYIALEGVQAIVLELYKYVGSHDTISQNITFDYAACPVLVATDEVTLGTNTGAGKTFSGFVAYIEEDAP